MQGYNGSFLFNTLDAYGITEAGVAERRFASRRSAPQVAEPASSP